MKFLFALLGGWLSQSPKRRRPRSKRFWPAPNSRWPQALSNAITTASFASWCPAPPSEELAQNGLASAKGISEFLQHLGPRRSGLCAFKEHAQNGAPVARSLPRFLEHLAFERKLILKAASIGPIRCVDGHRRQRCGFAQRNRRRPNVRCPCPP